MKTLPIHRLLRRSAVAGGVAITVLALLFVGVVRASGQPTRNVRFNDASFWDADRSTGRITHWNTAVELSGVSVIAAKRVTRSLFALEQGHAGVVLVDRSAGAVRVFDDREQRFAPSTWKLSADVEVRVGTTAVWIIEPAVGKLYRVGEAELLSTNDLGSPWFDFGSPIVAALGADDSLHVLIPSAGELTTFTKTGTRRKIRSLGKLSARTQLTAIGATPVVFDPETSELQRLAETQQPFEILETFSTIAQKFVQRVLRRLP